MKKLIILLLMAGVIGLWGCAKKEPGTAGEPMAGNAVPVTCDAFEVCGYRIQTSFTHGQTGEFRYVLKLWGGTGGPYYSESVKAYSSGSTTPMSLTFTFPYWNPLETGWHLIDVEIHSATSSGRNPRERLTASGGTDSVEITDQFSSTCLSTCCTDTLIVKPRWYAMASRSQAGARGIKAYLRNCCEPEMCGDQFSEVKDRSFAYIAVGNQATGFWCQAGFIAGRNDGEQVTHYIKYFEVKGQSGIAQVELGATSLDAVVDFEITLDRITGTWKVYTFGIFRGSVQDPGWANLDGDHLTAACEIIHHETDIFGDVGANMVFTHLGWYDGYNFHDVPTNQFSRYSDDWTEWVVDTVDTDTAILIYDLQPK